MVGYVDLKSGYLLRITDTNEGIYTIFK